MGATGRRRVWIGVALVALAAVALHQYADLGRLLTLESLKGSRDALVASYHQSPGTFIVERAAATDPPSSV